MKANNCMYSNDLSVCKEQLRECVYNSCLGINCDDILDALHEPIDMFKFAEWFGFSVGIIQTKQNKQSYFNKAFLSELNKGRFKIKEFYLDTTSLIKALRDKEIKVLSNDTAYIEIMWETILKSGLSIDSATELNHKIVDYMKKGQSFTDYVELVKKSKALKDYKIDWMAIDKKYQEEINRWTQMLNELNEGEFYGKDE